MTNSLKRRPFEFLAASKWWDINRKLIKIFPTSIFDLKSKVNNKNDMDAHAFWGYFCWKTTLLTIRIRASKNPFHISIFLLRLHCGCERNNAPNRAIIVTCHMKIVTWSLSNSSSSTKLWSMLLGTQTVQVLVPVVILLLNIMPKTSMSWKSVWIYLKSQIKFCLKFLFKYKFFIQ